MRITPRAHWVLARYYEPDKIGEIVLPDAYKGQSARCQVVAVGSEVTACKPEDWILLTPPASAHSPFPGLEGHYISADPNDDTLYLMHEDSVIATCEYEPADSIPRPLLATARLS